MSVAIGRWLREPLLQFLLAGLLLFGGYTWLNPRSRQPDPNSRIEITVDDLRAISPRLISGPYRPVT